MNTFENWEEFAFGETRPAGERIHVTLNYKGGMLLNKKAYEALGSPEAVTLLFENRGLKIGLKPCPLHHPSAFRCKKFSKGSTRIIHTSPFCRNYGIKTDGTIAFHDIDITNEGMMVLDLQKTSRVSRVGRRF